MKTTTHHALAARRRRQAALLSLGGVAVLGLGLYLNLRSIGLGGAPVRRLDVVYTYACLVIGSLLSWVGVALADRWTVPPRADEALAGALKGAVQALRLYNWVLPADHVLLTPWGLIVAWVVNHEGPIAIHGTRWRDRRPLLRRLLSFGRRPVRDPGRLLALEADALRRALAARDEELGAVTIEPVVVFSRPGVRLTVEEPSVPALRAAELREWLRAQARRPALAPVLRRRLERALDGLAEARLARR